MRCGTGGVKCVVEKTNPICAEVAGNVVVSGYVARRVRATPADSPMDAKREITKRSRFGWADGAKWDVRGANQAFEKTNRFRKDVLGIVAVSGCRSQGGRQVRTGLGTLRQNEICGFTKRSRFGGAGPRLSGKCEITKRSQFQVVGGSWCRTLRDPNPKAVGTFRASKCEITNRSQFGGVRFYRPVRSLSASVHAVVPARKNTTRKEGRGVCGSQGTDSIGEIF